MFLSLLPSIVSKLACGITRIFPNQHSSLFPDADVCAYADNWSFADNCP